MNSYLTRTSSNRYTRPIATALGLALIFSLSSVHATIYDLTGKPSSATINSAIFQVPSVDIVAGTGVIQPFVRIQMNGTESGYNRDLAGPGDSHEFDAKKGIWTHALQLSDIQTNKTTVGTTDYYEFVLDINESAGGQDGINSLLSLHELEIYVDGVGTNNDYSAGLGNLVYDLDNGGDNVVELDYDNFPGSGKLDMIALIPTAVFGTDLDQYIYFFSAFGTPNASTAGFEEWAVKSSGTFTPCEGDDCDGGPPILLPEPASLLLIGTGLMGLAFSRRRKLV